MGQSVWLSSSQYQRRLEVSVPSKQRTCCHRDRVNPSTYQVETTRFKAVYLDYKTKEHKKHHGTVCLKTDVKSAIPLLMTLDLVLTPRSRSTAMLTLVGLVPATLKLLRLSYLLVYILGRFSHRYFAAIIISDGRSQ
jgi:hypothetical protein